MQTTQYGSSSAFETPTPLGFRSSSQVFQSLGRATSTASLTSTPSITPKKKLWSHSAPRLRESKSRIESAPSRPPHAISLPIQRPRAAATRRKAGLKPSEGLTRPPRAKLPKVQQPSNPEKGAVRDAKNESDGSQQAPVGADRRRSSTLWPFFNSRRLSAYPKTSDPVDPRRQIYTWEVWVQRIIFFAFVIGVNLTCAIFAFKSTRHAWVLGLLVFMKSKDILSTIAGVFGSVSTAARKVGGKKEKDPSPKWILSLICAYAETEEQIMKTVMSTIEQDVKPHKQLVCIILDGEPCPIKSHFTVVAMTMRRPYVTWQHKRGELDIYAGLIGTVPVILIEKVQNAGKKDSLILGHSLFNYPREDAPLYIKLLREEMFALILPRITGEIPFPGFNYVFCTDADSILHEHAMLRLTEALEKDDDAVAACGVLFAELAGPEVEWTTWHLFQQYQYSFGQYVRRRAEGTWKRVTCLPGCITLIAVRPEFAPALAEYAAPVTNRFLLEHQVQYLGTDRRLTYCMLAQGTHLHTLFVSDALSETVAPQTLEHYLSQRRRWASNAYFNDFYYCFGRNQRLITRLFALIDIVRLTLVFYRVVNTAEFLHSLIGNFYIIRIVPLLVVTKTPAVWFTIIVLLWQPILRRRMHKLIVGLIIDQIISPFLSTIVFLNVVLRMGSAVWGRTGASTEVAPVAVHPLYALAPNLNWTPERVNVLVRRVVKDRQGRDEQLHCLTRTSTHHSI